MKAIRSGISRYQAGALLISFCCLLSSAEYCRDSLANPRPFYPGIDISALEKSLETARPTLANVTKIGFITDARPDRVTKVDAGLVLMQYVMYPIIVKLGTGDEFVLGWFHKGVPAQYPGLVEVANFGQGVVLYQRMNP